MNALNKSLSLNSWSKFPIKRLTMDLKPLRSLFIQTEQTPSTDTLKFKPGRPVLGEEARATIEFRGIREAMEAASPLGTTLMKLPGVQSILFGPDFVGVTKDPSVSWSHVKPSVFSVLTDHFSLETLPALVGDEFAQTALAPPKDTEILPEDSEVVAMIKELLDSRIRPTIQDDGGDLEFCGFDPATGVVKLKLKGACRTCDSSIVTLKNGIENMLQYFIPEVTKVEQVMDVTDEEFLKFEKTIESKNDAK